VVFWVLDSVSASCFSFVRSSQISEKKKLPHDDFLQQEEAEDSGCESLGFPHVRELRP